MTGTRKRVTQMVVGLLCLLCWRGVPCDTAATPQRGWIAQGTRWETPYHIVDSGVAGPTVLVTAGIHGNEPAGTLTADQVIDWSLTKGKLVVIPRCSLPGLKERTRNLPGTASELRDLNRNFPTDDDTPPRGEPAGSIWRVVEALKPDYLLDLHEGYGIRGGGSKSVGSSVIRNGHKAARRLQAVMLDAVNADIADKSAQFVSLSMSTTGSLARACGDRIGCCSFILETTYKGQSVAQRVRQHRLMVHALLKALGMVANSAVRIAPERSEAGECVVVARYNGPGAGYDTVPDLFETGLGCQSNVVLRRVCAADIADGVLDQFDVVIFPGGSGSGQAKGLGLGGRARVQRFIGDGGGYVGICGGAYLATANYDWSLGIIDADSIDRSHWRRGRGTVTLGLTETGGLLLDYPASTAAVHFAQGPILAPAERRDLVDYTVLATFLSGVGTNGADPQTMVNTAAIVTGAYGKGRVVVISPHPEQTDGLEMWLARLVCWAAGE